MQHFITFYNNFIHMFYQDVKDHRCTKKTHLTLEKQPYSADPHRAAHFLHTL